MKQKDIFLIGLVVLFSGITSYFVSNLLFASPDDLKADVEIVEPINSEFNEPDKRYFNEKSIDPTQQITIGDDKNQQPFQSTN